MKAILQASFQVLEESSFEALTTTRVAAVAGVSVGTLYQYFPHREALIAGLLAAHLERAVATVEDAVGATHGMPRAEAVATVVRAFLSVKAERAAISAVLQPALAAIDARAIVRAARVRAQAAVAVLLASPAEPDAQILERAGILCAALEGIVTSIIEADAERLTDPSLHATVVALALAVVASPT